MKVLFLTNIPSPYRVLFFREFAKKCDLTVVYELSHATDRDPKWKEESVKNFKEVYLTGFRTGSDNAICFGIKNILRERYDAIIIGGYASLTSTYAMLLLKLRRIPFLLNADGGFIRREPRIKYLIKRFLISKANGWLSTGEHTSKYLEYYGANPAYIYTYPFSSNLEADILNEPVNLNEKKVLKQKLNILENKMVLYVGQFINRKGIDVLVEATKRLDRNIGVYLIGGEPSEELIKMKQDSNLENIYFIPFKSKEELKDYYKAADLFVLPTREDIWGLVINEAMANGLPIVTTNRCIAGMEMVEEKNGKIVETEDVKALYDAINSILCDSVKLHNMMQCSIATAKKYTIEKMAEEHIKILKDLYTTK